MKALGHQSTRADAARRRRPFDEPTSFDGRGFDGSYQYSTVEVVPRARVTDGRACAVLSTAIGELVTARCYRDAMQRIVAAVAAKVNSLTD